MTSWIDETVVITGAASGIGRALANAFAAEGARLALIDIDAKGLQACNEALDVDVLTIEADVSVEAEMREAAARVEREFGPVSVLCNNAGVGVAGSALDTPSAVWEWTFAVNVRGVINGTQAFVPAMVERDYGQVMNVASVAGLLAPAGMAAYVTSKHAVVGFTESLHHELTLRHSNVVVSVACPAMVDTAIGMSERNWPARLGALPSLFDSRLVKVIQRKHQRALSRAMPADVAAAKIIEGMQHRQFWIVTDDVYTGQILAHGDVRRSPDAPAYL